MFILLASCPNLPHPDHGTRRFNGNSVGIRYWPGTVVTYSCNTGYTKIHGSESRTCQSSGQWNRDPLECAESNTI